MKCAFRFLFFAVGVATVLSAAAENLTLDLNLAVSDRYSADEDLEPESATVVISAADGTDESQTFETIAPGRLRVPVPHGRYSISLQSDRYWVEPRVISVSASGLETIPLVPLGRVVGELEVPRGSEAPKELRVHFQPTDSPERGWQGTLLCALEGSKFACPVPAFEADLKVRAPGHITHFFWGLEVSRSKATAVGRLRLVSGATVTGWITTEDGSDLPRDLKVLAHAAGHNLSLPRNEELQKQMAVHEGAVSPRGYFHIGGLPPGQQIVTAVAKGYVATRAPVEVIGQGEAELRFPLVLARPVEIQVVVDPPVAPSGERWTLELSEIDTYSNIVPDPKLVLIGEDGLVEAAGFAPVSYRVALSLRDGTRFALRDVDLEQEGMPLVFELDIIEIEGHVSWDGFPIEADLWFGGEKGAKRSFARSDEDGRFSLFVEQEGAWRVEVVAPSLGIHHRIPEVMVKRPSSGGVAVIELEIPATRAAGRVVDPSGQFVAEALVFAAPSGEGGWHESHRKVENDGRFEFIGLPEGQASIYAEGRGGLSSNRVLVELKNGEDVEDIELVLHQSKTLAGQVVGPRGPVMGAMILVDPFQVTAESASQVTTNAQGIFEVTVPREAERVWLTVGSPGLTADFRTVELSQEFVTIQLSQYGGSVRLLGERDEETHLMLFKDGQPIFASWLRSWIAMNPGDSEVQENVARWMPPGQYQYCRVPRNDVWAWGRSGPLDPSLCAAAGLAGDAQIELSAEAAAE